MRASLSLHFHQLLQRSLRLMFPLMLGVLLAGCASLSEDQCRSGRWAQVGESDGASGQPAGRFFAHREACGEYGIDPVEADYLAGHGRGLLHYCTARNALREGLAGRSYQGVCPPVVHLAFAELHARAYDVYRARQAVDSIEDEIRDRERERRSDKTSSDRRKEISNELRRLDQRLYRARDSLRERELDLDRAARLSAF